MQRWQLCRAIEEAGGLLPANWLWLERAPRPGELEDLQTAVVLSAACGPLAELALPARPLRLLSHPGTARQRCRPYSCEPEGPDWLLLVGEAAGPNRWESRPLYGQRIALTRELEQARPLSERLQELGAEVVLCPVLQFVPPDDPEPLRQALSELESYAWVLFTSPNGVRYFFQALFERSGDTRRLGGARLAAIGPGTAAALRDRGLLADVVPSQSMAEGLLEALAEHPMQGLRVLLPRAQEARELLPEELGRRGARVDVVPVYKTIMPEPPPELQEVDRVVLMSSSAARHFRHLTKGDPQCVCIGPVTDETARQLGFTRRVQARQFDLEGVVRALLDAPI